MLQSGQPNLRKYKALQYTTATYIIQGFQNESKETVYLIYYLAAVYSKLVLKSIMNIQHSSPSFSGAQFLQKENLLPSHFFFLRRYSTYCALNIITGCNFFFWLSSNRTTKYFILYQRRFNLPNEISQQCKSNILEEK